MCLHNSELIWYIVFEAADTDYHWVQKLIKYPFYHCYCFREITPYVLETNTSLANIDHKIYEVITAKNLALMYSMKKDTIVLQYKAKLDFNNRINHIGNLWPTCVNVTKMCLGFTSFSYTPYALYKKLLARGAIII